MDDTGPLTETFPVEPGGNGGSGTSGGRQDGPTPEAPEPQHRPLGGVARRFQRLFATFTPRDILSSSIHSADFSGSRSQYINPRVRAIAAVLAVVTPLWIVIDVFTLTGPKLFAIVALRIACGAAFAAIALLSRPTIDIKRVRLSLVSLVATCALFYSGAKLILDGSLTQEGFLSGYTYLPLAQAALLALFPVTLLEGALLSALVLAGVIGTESILGDLFFVEILGYLWLLGIILGTSLVAEGSQLHMLLRLHRQATRDALTGLFNRRALMQRFEEELSRVRRYGGTMSVILCDLDRFKRTNDKHGHLAGDAVLQRFAEVLTDGLRAMDTVGRYGGEEFLAILPATSATAARMAAERIRVRTESERAASPHGTLLSFTVSIGVAELTETDTSETLFRKVDESLYRAKGEGRNRVVVSE